jgi:subfamily B ATP-binding cassette protein MsbA
LKFFHDHPSGQLISRVVNDVSVMRAAVMDSLTGIGKSLLTLVFLVAVMFHQDWVLALSAFCIFPFAAGFVAWIGGVCVKFQTASRIIRPTYRTIFLKSFKESGL